MACGAARSKGLPEFLLAGFLISHCLSPLFSNRGRILHKLRNPHHTLRELIITSGSVYLHAVFPLFGDGYQLLIICYPTCVGIDIPIIHNHLASYGWIDSE